MSSATDAITVRVRVQPRGSRNQVQRLEDGSLRIRTTAPPADGRANKDVARQLAKAYGVPPSRVTLVRGATHRDKVFRIELPGAEPDFPPAGPDDDCSPGRIQQ
jgi:uncharacterized protein (TIGR00251 family)